MGLQGSYQRPIGASNTTKALPLLVIIKYHLLVILNIKSESHITNGTEDKDPAQKLFA